MTAAHASGRVQSLLGLASQLLNAATNVVSVYLASLLLVPEEFGPFVLAFAAVTLVLATVRGLIGATMLAQLPSVRGEHEQVRLVRSAFGFTVLVGLAGTAALLVVALWTPAVLWFTPWLVIALLHDVARHVFIAMGRRGDALVLDVVWAVVQAAFLVVLLVVDGPLTVATLATAWGAGGAVGLAVFVTWVGAPARPAGPRLWVRSTRDIAGWFTAICGLGQLELYLVLLLAGVLLSPADAGGLRAVQLLVFQPPLVMCGALIAIITPGIARAGATELDRIWRRAMLAVAPIGVLVLLVAVFGHAFMSLLFGQYVDYADLVLPIAVQSTAILLSVPTSALLMGIRRGRVEFTLHVARTVLALAAAVLGASLAGSTGMAWALAAAAVTVLALMTVVARRELRRAERDGTGPGPDAGVPPPVPGAVPGSVAGTMPGAPTPL